MKILIEFDIEDEEIELEDFLIYLEESMDGSDTPWNIKKYPKKYKKIIEDYI